MNKVISSKFVALTFGMLGGALTFGILVVCFAIGFYVIAWQEPTQEPPADNVPPPINVGTEPQAKAGRLSVTELYDYNDPSYYLNPAGDSFLGPTLTIGGGAGKINVGTIDPVFDIDGKKYATYVPANVGGVRMKTFGKVRLEADSRNKLFQSIIDFDELEKGSNLWLFEKTTDFGKNMENLNVFLTPEGEYSNLYYQLNPQENQVVIYGDKPITVSYYFSAPRFDHEDWSNVAKDQSLKGLKILK